MLELKVAQKVIKAVFTLIKSLFGGYICYNLYHKNFIKSIENRPIWHKSPNLTQISQFGDIGAKAPSRYDISTNCFCHKRKKYFKNFDISSLAISRSVCVPPPHPPGTNTIKMILP